jgi:hypothetical protein
MRLKALSRDLNFFPQQRRKSWILREVPTRTKVNTVEEPVSTVLHSEGAVCSNKLVDSQEIGKHNSNQRNSNK